jgi:spermidine synthase
MSDTSTTNGAAYAAVGLAAGIAIGVCVSKATSGGDGTKEIVRNEDATTAATAATAASPPQNAESASASAEPEIRSGFWYEEEQLPTFITKVGLNKVLYEGKSPFQTISIVETNPFGLTLLLDGKTQSSALDEVVYHECLVHPAMLLHPNPESVFIGGGGECATAREILRHKSVKECIMVDIDEEVVRVSLEKLPTWSDGCFEDPRLKVYYEDAYAYIENYKGKFDVIIMDIADPIEAGPGIKLYTKEFYQMAITRLNPGGMIVTQSGVGSILNHTECFTVIHQTMKSVFDNVVIYTADTPSFGTLLNLDIITLPLQSRKARGQCNCGTNLTPPFNPPGFNWGFNLAFNNEAEVAKQAIAKGVIAHYPAFFSKFHVPLTVQLLAKRDVKRNCAAARSCQYTP